ncbi:hypothetical protein L6R53_06730 [Myxococcota bacterium]|nr:hypothetical protein [Myxococcota bacterium]
MTPTLLAAVLSCLSPALAESATPTATLRDTVSQVSAGTSADRAGLQVAVWTSTSRVTPAGVHLELAPFPGAPALAVDQVDIPTSAASRQVWQAEGVRFDQPARGALVPARATLLDAAGGELATVELTLAAGGLTCADAAPVADQATSHAHLHLDPTGQSGTLALILDAQHAPAVASVRFELGASTTGAAPTQRVHVGTLARVQQLWTAELPVRGAAGQRYQVDGVVIDPEGQPYGVAFAAELPVDAGPPATSAPCPFGRSAPDRLAALR